MNADRMAGFVAALEPINALADTTPGFVWRLQDDSGDATSIRVFDDKLMLINMSVWESVDALADFVYRSEHTAVMRGRKQWFETMRFYLTLWWVRPGHRPTPGEARDRLETGAPSPPRPDRARVHFQRRFAPGDEHAIVGDELKCPA